MKFDIAVLIGRFSPFHLGHQSLVERALQLADQVVILLGSAAKPRTIKNPWTAEERAVMIRHCFPGEAARIHCLPLKDRLYNDQQWVRDVQDLVGAQARELGLSRPRVALVGHHKDRSSYYLDMFPQWSLEEAPNIRGVSSTELRQYLLGEPDNSGNRMLLEAALPRPVFAFIESFRASPAFPQLVREFDFIAKYKASWAVAPYPPVFMTVDAVVVHSGHLLLVRRRAEPGRGLWALPGGFVDQQERLADAVIRELREETRVKLPVPVLRGAIKADRMFDHPERSLRGRTITQAYLFEFPAGDLPEVKGADDADKAHWFPLAQVREMDEQLFDDHGDIINYFIGGI